jgi:hypothetical protein
MDDEHPEIRQIHTKSRGEIIYAAFQQNELDTREA